MAEADPTPEPQALVRRDRRGALSLVWIVPIIAAIIGITVAVKAVLARGPTISIQLRTAEGLEAGKTKIRYRDVDIGTVRAIELTDDHKAVRVIADLRRNGDDLLARDSKFWVVRPRVAVGGVSGLDTLLSGAYIGMDIGTDPERSRDFMGLEQPPVVASDNPGREFILHGQTLGSVDVGSPVYFRHLPAGRVIQYSLDPSGGGVTLGVFITSPYDRFVTTDTRFWNASGVDVSIGANGLQLNTESLATILTGGIAFETPPDSTVTARAPAKTSFRLQATRSAAMAVPHLKGDVFIMYFKGSLRGLSIGAPVELHGVEVGEVRSIEIEYDSTHSVFRYPVQIVVYEDRIRAHYRAGAAPVDVESIGANAFAAGLIAHGMRGQLKTGNLLTGQQLVSLDYFPKAAAAHVDTHQNPMEFPTVGGELDDLQDTLTDIAKKVDAMPLEQIAADARGTMVELRHTLVATNALIARLNTDTAPELQGAIKDARHTLAGADQLLSTDAPLQRQLQQSLEELSHAARALSDLADMLERHPESLLRGKPKDHTP